MPRPHLTRERDVGEEEVLDVPDDELVPGLRCLHQAPQQDLLHAAAAVVLVPAGQGKAGERRDPIESNRAD